METTKLNQQKKGLTVSSDRQIGTSFEEEKRQFAQQMKVCINNNPIGKLLTILGSLPEVRRQKVEQAKTRITDESDYETGQPLDEAIDIVLDELLGD